MVGVGEYYFEIDWGVWVEGFLVCGIAVFQMVSLGI